MSYFFWLLFIRLFNYEKAKIRHFPNIFTPFGVGEFTGMEGDTDIYLTIEETKICTKSNYLFSFYFERIYRCSKEWGAAWKFI